MAKSYSEEATKRDSATCHPSHVSFFERLSYWAVVWTGSSWAFALMLGVVILWFLSGPFFGFTDTWQLIINTSTTIITFLMVFLLQRSQNKEFLAMQLKLNEIIAAMKGASNRLINVEDLSEAEVVELHERYQELIKAVAQDPLAPHSVEEAAKERTQQGEEIGAGS